MCVGFVNSARRAVQAGNRTNNLQSPHTVLKFISLETHFCKRVGIPFSCTSVKDNLGYLFTGD